MIKEAIIKLSKKENLTYTEAEEVMNEIMEGKASGLSEIFRSTWRLTVRTSGPIRSYSFWMRRT